MNASTPFASPRECFDERRVLEEVAAADRPGHAHQILVDDPPGADREVTDLGVPHLSVGQPDRFARGIELRMREPFEERVEDRRGRELDRVAGPRRGEPPAVENDERYEGN